MVLNYVPDKVKVFLPQSFVSAEQSFVRSLHQLGSKSDNQNSDDHISHPDEKRQAGNHHLMFFSY